VENVKDMKKITENGLNTIIMFLKIWKILNEILKNSIEMEKYKKMWYYYIKYEN